MSKINKYPTFHIADSNGDLANVSMSFKEWVIELCNWGDYNFLLEGLQTGEIYDMHEYYIQGVSPQEAAHREWYKYARI